MEAFRDLLASQGAVFAEDGRVLAFDGNAGEYGAFAGEDGAGLVPLLAATPLRLTGADRLDFLHGQISNDVKGLGPDGANSALMLNHKGHALAQMRVYRRPDDLFVVVEGGKGPVVLEQLRAHIIFDQVEIQDLTETLSTLTLQGPAASGVLGKVLGEAPREGSFVQHGFADAEVLVSPVRRSGAGGFDLHVLSRDAGTLWGALLKAGATAAGEDASDIARVEAGIAAAETEGGEGILPQEAGLDRYVSYRKGCYLGQEIMARIEARGRLHRELRGLRLEAWPEGRSVAHGGKPVGQLGKVVRHPDLGIIALAVLRTDAQGTSLEAGGAAAEATTLPWMAAERPRTT